MSVLQILIEAYRSWKFQLSIAELWSEFIENRWSLFDAVMSGWNMMV